MIKAILFDLDGTLLDTEKLYSEAEQVLAEATERMNAEQVEKVLAGIFSENETARGAPMINGMIASFNYDFLIICDMPRIVKGDTKGKRARLISSRNRRLTSERRTCVRRVRKRR